MDHRDMLIRMICLLWDGPNPLTRCRRSVGLIWARPHSRSAAPRHRRMRITHGILGSQSSGFAPLSATASEWRTYPLSVSSSVTFTASASLHHRVHPWLHSIPLVPRGTSFSPLNQQSPTPKLPNSVPLPLPLPRVFVQRITRWC